MIKKEILKPILRYFDLFLNTSLYSRLISLHSKTFDKNDYPISNLDLVFIQNISNIEILEEGETTTSCSVMYDIVRKFNNEKKISFNLVNENKINLEFRYINYL